VVVVVMQRLRKQHGPMEGHELAPAVVEKNFHIVPLASRMVDVVRHSWLEVSLA
jgi:hypothetical protein